MTEQGGDQTELRNAIKKQKIAALITIANANNPLGTTQSLHKKRALLQIAKQHDIVVIEDDIYGDTHFIGARPHPLRALNPDVILCSSFSKTLAPGIRVGWVAGARWTPVIKSLKLSSTMATAIYPQAAVAEFLRTGGYDLHLRKLRRTLRYQVEKIRDAIIAYFPRGTVVSEPSGGYVLWVCLAGDGINSRELFELARRQGIGIAPGYLFASDSRYDHCFRINAGFGWNPEIEHAIRTLASIVSRHNVLYPGSAETTS